MFKKLTAAAAAFAMLGGVALADFPGHWLDDAEAHTWEELRAQTLAEPTPDWTAPDGFAWELGEPLPAEAPVRPLARLPGQPDEEELVYVVHDDMIIVAEADTGAVVFTMPADG